MSQWSERTKALVLFGLALVIYGFGIGRAFMFDDVIYISQNPLLRRPDAFRVFWFSSEAFNYYPLFWSFLRLQWLLWGDHPLGYHLVNLLIHCVNVVLVWRIGRAWNLPGAWWAAALFAVHPINVQTVAWAAEQKNTWSFLFMAFSLLAFIKHTRQRDWASYGLSLLCFLGALACKTSTVCLPVFLAIYCVFRGEKPSRALLMRIIPFLAAGLAAGITTMWFEQNIGAQSLLGTLSFWQRAEAAGAAFWFYLMKALVPIQLTPMYRGWADTAALTHTAVPGAFLLLLLAVCALCWRRIGAPVALGLGYYALMLLPLLGIWDTNYFIYSQIADHWQYHALPGLLVAVVTTVSYLPKRWPRLAVWSNPVGTLAVLSLAALASAHFAHFEDARTLWTYVVTRNPDAWLGWYNLGNEYSDEEKYSEAIASYQRSIRVKPDYYRAHFNLANTLATADRFEEADQAYLQAQRIQPKDPAGFVNRAVLLLRMGREDEAVTGFKHALQLDPEQPSAQVNLITINLRSDRIDEAATFLKPSAVSGDANSSRVAAAITASRERGNVPRAMLEQFAVRALNLSGGQRDLFAALAAMQNPH